MKSEWSGRRLSDVATFENRHRVPLSAQERENRRGPYPYWGANGPFDSVDDYLFEGPRVLVAEDGTVVRPDGRGNVHWATGRYWVNNHAHVLSVSAENDLRWLYYALRDARISDFVTGSVQPKLSMRSLSLLPLSVPPLHEQQIIADILGALDDKIESNRRLATFVRELAEGIFERAVASDFVETTIGSGARFHNRRRRPLSAAQRRAMPGEVPYYGATGVFDYVAEPIFNDVFVLVGEDGSVVREDGGPVLQYIWGPAWVNNHAHILTGEGISNEILLFALDRCDVRSRITGAVQPKLSMRNLREVDVRVPSPAAQRVFTSPLTALFDLYRAKTDECATVAAIRNALLPRLISGQIRVADGKERE